MYDTPKAHILGRFPHAHAPSPHPWLPDAELEFPVFLLAFLEVFFPFPKV